MVRDQMNSFGVRQISLEEGLQLLMIGELFFELLEDWGELLSEDVRTPLEVCEEKGEILLVEAIVAWIEDDVGPGAVFLVSLLPHIL